MKAQANDDTLLREAETLARQLAAISLGIGVQMLQQRDLQERLAAKTRRMDDAQRQRWSQIEETIYDVTALARNEDVEASS